MHADKRRCTQTDADTHGRMQTHAKFFSCIPCPSCYMFRPWVSLPANPCPMLMAFQEPEIQLALDRLFPKPCPPTYSAQNQHILGRPSLILGYVLLRGLLMVEGSQLQACERRCTQMHVDVHRRTQTHADKCRCTETNTDARRQTQTHRDECKANCIRYVGGHNLKTRPDVRRLEFQDALYNQCCVINTVATINVYP